MTAENDNNRSTNVRRFPARVPRGEYHVPEIDAAEDIVRRFGPVGALSVAEHIVWEAAYTLIKGLREAGGRDVPCLLSTPFADEMSAIRELSNVARMFLENRPAFVRLNRVFRRQLRARANARRARQTEGGAA